VPRWITSSETPQQGRARVLPMPRKFPVYLSQEQVDQWVPALLAYQHATDVLSHDPTRDQAYRMATEIRRQCCDRSGASDPFPELPHIPGIIESRGRKRGWK
jgi:hypothetical protein